MRAVAPVLLLVFAAACAAPSAPPLSPAEQAANARAAVARRVVAMAATQVRQCYRAPRLTRAARQIVTVVRVRYSIDGNLVAQPELIRQSGIDEGNAVYAGRMAEAAIAAVMRCTPLQLPAEFHDGGWDDFELTFSPKGLA